MNKSEYTVRMILPRELDFYEFIRILNESLAHHTEDSWRDFYNEEEHEQQCFFLRPSDLRIEHLSGFRSDTLSPCVEVEYHKDSTAPQPEYVPPYVPPAEITPDTVEYISPPKTTPAVDHTTGVNEMKHVVTDHKMPIGRGPGE